MRIDLSEWNLKNKVKIMLKDRNTSRLLDLTNGSYKNTCVLVFNMGVYYDTIGVFAEKLKKFNDAIKKLGNLIIAVRGSDDNPELFKQENWDALSNIKLIEDYTVLDFGDENNALVLGGDLSLDKKWKVDHGRYWENEEPVFDYRRVKSPIELGYSINTLIIPTKFMSSPEIIDELWMNEFDTEIPFKMCDIWCDASKMILKMRLMGHDIENIVSQEPSPRFNFARRNTIHLNDFTDFCLGKNMVWD